MRPRTITRLLSAGLAGCVIFLPVTVKAQTATIGSEARVLEQIRFALLLQMDFGKIAPNPNGGQVVLDASSDSRDCSNALACVGDYSISELRISGTDANVTVNYDTAVQLTGPGTSMTVTPQLPGGTGQTFTLSGGEIVLKFGATLFTNANQVAGSYSGPFTVNVTYE